MILAAVAAVTLAVAGEPAVPKSDEAFFGRVLAPLSGRAELRVGDCLRRDVVASGHLSHPVRCPPGRYEVRLAVAGGRQLVARRAWLLPQSAGRAIPERGRDARLAERLAALGRAYAGYAAIWTHDLRTGRTAGWNADASFPAASIVKLGVLIAALDRFGPRPERSDAWPDIRAMATWSANDSANRLVARLGGPRAIQAVLHRVGATASTYPGDYRLNTSVAGDAPRPVPFLTTRRTTAHDAGRLLYAIQAAALGQPEAARRTGLSRHEARVGLALLLSAARTGDNAGILGATGPAARKEGWTTKIRHSAAILFLPAGPRIVVVLTYRPDEIDERASRRLGTRVVGIVRRV